MSEKMLRIKLVKSYIGAKQSTKKNLFALGLRKMQQVVEHKDSPHIRGMIFKAKHLISVEEV
ncbi:MAG: 50S ribosomal protein L30 [Candidatus Cloacimonadota bacterium]|nr:MAG: 50S ribosomal protein L30 [Candidatus Cloacimonadota bacterium]PIE79138.1 MAG: 50S ribosomal protein L30 [Candidatus Delongbacteria bacterium]